MHLPSDNQGKGLEELVLHMCGRMEGISKIAVAGGVKLDTISVMKNAGVDIVIVGGAINKAADITAAAKAFAEAVGR